MTPFLSPILDLKVWVNEEQIIVHQFYEKPVSPKHVIHPRSALSRSSKTTIFTSEVIRRLLNNHPSIEWREMRELLVGYCCRMARVGHT